MPDQDRIVAVGSTNLDALSLNKMNEGMLVVVDEGTVRREATQFLGDLALAKTLMAQPRVTAAEAK